MLNYLKAELYKLLRQRAFCFGLSLLFVLEALFLLLIWLTDTGWSMDNAVGVLAGLLPVGFFLVYPLSSSVFSEQHKHNTLKNEIPFGLPRARIYLGKLVAEAITCILVCALVVVFYLGINLVLFRWPWSAEMAADLRILGYCLLLALPVWLGSLGLLHMLQFTIKSTTAVVILYIAFFLVVEPMNYLLSQFILPDGRNVFVVVALGLLSSPLSGLAGALESDRLGWAWAVGMGWLAVTTTIGLGVFQKRDIK